MSIKKSVEDYYEPLEVAAKLKTNTQTLASWRSNGRVSLPFVKVGRKVLYPVKQVHEYLEKHTYNHTGECAA